MRNSVLLLVEDNKRDEILTLRAFEKCGIASEIIVVHNGVEALDYIFGTGEYAGRDTTRLPRFVLLDLKLPKMDGMQVLARLRADQRTEGLPVVIFTSSIEREDMIKSYGLGANSYVRKPVDFEQYSDAIRQLGLYWLVLNETVPELI